MAQKELKVEIIKGNLLEVAVDAIVNPANSLGVMGGGVAGVIRRAGGVEIEQEAISRAPIPVGNALVTTAGKLPFRGIIHAPTMEAPAMPASAGDVRKATLAALESADGGGFSSIAFPGMGTGVGGLSSQQAAVAMKEAIASFHPRSLEKVVLVALHDDLYVAWLKEFGKN